MRFCTLLPIALCVLAVGAYADISLVDASGLQFKINTDYTEYTGYPESAAGGVEDAAYTAAVTNVSTESGGTSTTTLTDAFDGYGGLLVNDEVYTDLSAPEMEDGGRELRFPVQQLGGCDVSRKVFVPDNDEFVRWLNIITNPSNQTKAVKLELISEVGSNGDTIIAESATGAKGVTIDDDWFVTGGDFGDPDRDPPRYPPGDPRLGHVMQGASGMIQLSQVENPFGGKPDKFRFQYDFEIPAGETYIIMHFVTGQPNIDDAAEQARTLWMLGGESLSGLSQSELANIVNFFGIGAPPGATCGANPAALSATDGVLSGDVGLIVLAACALLLLRRRSPVAG